MDRYPGGLVGGEALRRLLTVPSTGPIFVDLGDGLGRLEVWSEARWEAVVPGERPTHAEYVAELGWVVAVRMPDLN